MQKIVKIDYQEGEGLDKLILKGTVTMKRLNFSEKNAMDEESTDIKIIAPGIPPQVKVSTSKMREVGIFKSVVSSDLKKTSYFEDKTKPEFQATTEPFALTMDGVRNLPNEVGDMLWLAFVELNQINEKKSQS